MQLTRYWITFKPAKEPTFLNLGCGVTALGMTNALTLLLRALGQELPPIDQVIENVDVQTLDADHVIPNMGATMVRGVWFPKV